MKIVHVITGLEAGGAETMLARLVGQLEGEFANEVISLTTEGPLAARIRGQGAPVRAMGLRPGLAALRGLAPLSGLLRAASPDIVHCWMYHANLLGGMSARRAGAAAVVWGLRQSDLDPVRSKRGTILAAKLGARLSRRIPDRILCVSQSARDVHAGLGYAAERMQVVPNGFDTDAFRPDAAVRAALRAELDLGADALLVGLVARFDPQKDVPGFIEAAARVARSHPDARFVMCGQGMDAAHGALTAMIDAAGLAGAVRLLGRRDDMAAVTAALDISVSSSAFGEGFSNTLGEALCCAVPVVATDVGDSRLIVGEAGRVVAPRDPAALAAAVGELIGLGPRGREALGASGRARMMREYSIGAIAERYAGIYRHLLAPGLTSR